MVHRQDAAADLLPSDASSVHGLGDLARGVVVVLAERLETGDEDHGLMIIIIGSRRA